MKPGTGLYYFGVLLVLGTAWGFQFSMLKITSNEGYSEIGVLFISLIGLTLLYSGCAIHRKQLFRPTAGHLVYFTIGSLLGYVFPVLAVLYAAHHLSAGFITLIASLTPVVTVCVVLLLKTEIVTPLRIWAIAFGMAASLFVIFPEISFDQDSRLAWVMVMFAAPLCYGIDSIYIHRYWPADLSTLQVIAGEALVACILIIPVYLLFSDPIVYDPGWPRGQWAILLLILCGALEVMLFFYLVNKTGAVLVSFASIITLFSGIAWGILLFSETHPATTWAAVGLLTVALCLVAKDAIQHNPEINRVRVEPTG